jgi:hypothetical protein
LCAPQNFASYRQSELDNTRIQAFSQLEPLAYMSKRFIMKRYLGLSDEEILENEQLWQEERDQPELQTQSGQDLRSVGISPADIESDIGVGEEFAAVGGAPEGGITPGVDAVPGGAAAGAGPAGGAAPVPTI